MGIVRHLFLATLSFAAPALAVHVDPSGHGQALIYPYFTAQSKDGNAFNTYVSIVNRDPQGEGKALRVRFREGRNGREVAGFNVFLEHGDMWTAAVVPTSSGARLLTRDVSCTVPAFDVDFGFPIPPSVLNFSAAAFAGANSDGFGTDSNRLREGYIEVLEMARFNQDSPDPGTQCGVYRQDIGTGAFGAPSGGIGGALTVINVQDGTDFTVNAVALANLATDKYYRHSSDPYPDFDATEMDRTAAFVDNGRLYLSTWPSAPLALDAVLMRSFVDNEIVLDRASDSATDWVMTLPTKRFHAGAASSPPFQGGLVEGRDVILNLQFSDREGTFVQYVDECGFPCPGNTQRVDMRLRWAATVLSFRRSDAPPGTASGVLGSPNTWPIPLPVGAESGRASVGFGGVLGAPELIFGTAAYRIDNGELTPESFRLRGVPLVGFMVRTFRNGNLQCTGATCQGNYGGAFMHKYERDFQP